MTTTLEKGAAMRLKMPLDPMQRAAAEAPPGPIIVVGGPGSGKTQTLIGRIFALIGAGAYPAAITYLTLNSRAAEMARKQVAEAAEDPEIARKLYIGTFHSYASTFLRTVGAATLGRSPQYSMWDHDQAQAAISDMLDAMHIEYRDRDDGRQPPIQKMSTNEIKDFLQWKGYNKTRWLEQHTPARYSEWHQLLELYNQEKLRQNVIDLDDLVPMAVNALETNPKLRTKYSSMRSRHLLIDEFQDINPIQYRMLQLISSPDRSVTITTDPNQAINSWRGADIKMFDQFQHENNNAEIHMLRLNHRSTATLVDMAAELTADPAMTGLINAYQKPIRPHGPKPVHLNPGMTAAELSRFIVGQAQAQIDRGREWSDMAMIYRKKEAKNYLPLLLLERNIPYHVMGEVRKIGPSAIQRVTSLLASVLNPMDVAAFTSAATTDSVESGRGLNKEIVQRIKQISRERDINLLQATEVYLPSLHGRNKTRTNLEYVLRAWTYIREQMSRDDLSLEDLCRAAIRTVQRQQMERMQEGVHEPATQLLAITRSSGRLDQESLRAHTTRFLETLKAGAYPDLQEKSNENPLEANGGLTLTTIHASKGLQWPVVWVLDAVDSVIPGRANPDRPKEMEEEQKIFYVASTRATDLLIYCSPSKYKTPENGNQDSTEELKPTRFLEPMAGKLEVVDRLNEQDEE